MTRVSENSHIASLDHTIKKAKRKLEDLQLKGATMKKINRPSDDPINSVASLEISSRKSNNDQYVKNSNIALLHLNITDQVLEEVSNILLRAKEIAVAQSSDFYDGNIRKNVANDIRQMRNQLLTIANKRIGNRYIFAGHKTLDRPFNNVGEYSGDKGQIKVEVAKGFFIPINLNGHEVFMGEQEVDLEEKDPFEIRKDGDQIKFEKRPETKNKRELASVEIKPTAEEQKGLSKKNGGDDKFVVKTNIFSQLAALQNGLENNDPKLIQGILEKFDESMSRIITLRTKVGSLTNTINSTQLGIEKENIESISTQSKMVDSDVAKIFGDLVKQQHVLQTAYKSTEGLIGRTLIDFLK